MATNWTVLNSQAVARALIKGDPADLTELIQGPGPYADERWHTQSHALPCLGCRMDNAIESKKASCIV